MCAPLIQQKKKKKKKKKRKRIKDSWKVKEVKENKEHHK
jgi:hypothetical protein